MKKLLYLLPVVLCRLTGHMPCQPRPRSASVQFANIAEGTHDTGNLPKLADAALATRYLIVKHGTDADHVAIATAASDALLGVCTDEASAAEDPVNVFVIGAGKGTQLVTLGGVVALDGLITADSAGKGVAASSGNKIIGKALKAGVSGDRIPFAPAGAGAVAP